MSSKDSRTSVEDAPHSGRTKADTKSETIAAEVLTQDRRLEVSEITMTVNISKECAMYSLTEELSMKKLSVRWVQRLLCCCKLLGM